MPYLDLNNARIYYASYHSKVIGGVPVVLIHGAGENHLMWPAGLRRLPNADVYAIDLPGHGKSHGSGCRTIDDYTAWLAAFLDALHMPRAIIVGHSMGGAIALSFSRMYPDRTLGLVLIASGAKLRVAPQLLDLLQSDLPAAAELISRLEWGPNTPQPIIELGRQQLMAGQREVIYDDFCACNTFDMITRLNEIVAPALIVSGALDQLTPIKYAVFMAERIPHARLVSVPDAGHMVMIEAEAIVAHEVEQFVHGLATAAALPNEF